MVPVSSVFTRLLEDLPALLTVTVALLSRSTPDLASPSNAIRESAAGDADRTATLGRILIDGDGQVGPAVTRITRLDDRAWAGRLENRLRQLLIECRTLIPAFRGAVERRDWSAVRDWAAASQAGAESGLANQIEATRALVARLPGDLHWSQEPALTLSLKPSQRRTP